MNRRTSCGQPQASAIRPAHSRAACSSATKLQVTASSTSVAPRKNQGQGVAIAVSDFFSSATTQLDGTVVATEALTRLVSFKELNLVGPWPMTGAFDVIFCRNVTIYFNQETQAAIWARYAAVLRPEGHLLIGHSERLSEDVQSKFVSAGTTAYRLKSRAAA